MSSSSRRKPRTASCKILRIRFSKNRAQCSHKHIASSLKKSKNFFLKSKNHYRTDKAPVVTRNQYGLQRSRRSALSFRTSQQHAFRLPSHVPSVRLIVSYLPSIASTPILHGIPKNPKLSSLKAKNPWLPYSFVLATSLATSQFFLHQLTKERLSILIFSILTFL